MSLNGSDQTGVAPRTGVLERPAVILPLLALATLILIQGNLRGPFNPHLDPETVRGAVKGPWTDLFLPREGRTYAPLADLSLRLDAALFAPREPEAFERSLLDERRNDPTAQLNTWAYGPRVSSALLHLLSGILLWLFLRRLKLPGALAAFVAAVWTAHPVAVEAVSWASQRGAVLGACCGFGALCAWTLPRTSGWRWPLVNVLLAAALLSRLQAIGLLPVLLVLELTDPLGEPLNPQDPRGGVTLAERLGLPVLVAVAVAVCSSLAHQRELNVPTGGSAGTEILTQFLFYGQYTRHALLPAELSFFYGIIPVRTALDSRLLLYGGLALLPWVLAVLLRRPGRGPLVLLAGLWFAVPLAPVLTGGGTPYPFQDHFLYLALPGVLLALAVAVEGLLARVPVLEDGVLGLGSVFAVLIVCLSMLRSPMFFDLRRLVIESIRLQPRAAAARVWHSRLVYGELDAVAVERRERPTKEKRVEDRRTYTVQAAHKTLAALLSAYPRYVDFWRHADPAETALKASTSLLFIDDPAETVKVLEAVAVEPRALDPQTGVPTDYRGLPPDARLQVDGTAYRRTQARIWAALSEARLRMSYRTSESPEHQRLHARSAYTAALFMAELARFERSVPEREALLEADAQLRQAKATIRLSYLAAAANPAEATTAARGIYDKGAAQLRGLQARYASPESPEPFRLLAEQAAAVLKNVPPPEAPKTPAPVPPAPAVPQPAAPDAPKAQPASPPSAQ